MQHVASDGLHSISCKERLSAEGVACDWQVLQEIKDRHTNTYTIKTS
jgi:hypothetical protein